MVWLASSGMPPGPAYRPDPRYLSLGDGFADPVPPARFPRHVLRFRNRRHAARVGLDTLDDAEWEAAFARFEPLPGNLPEPLALRYHGHQFMSYNPRLGDGRGFLAAQVRDDRGRLLDLGTKGSGTTPYSRGGDGRLTLKGGVREVLATEMLESLGVDTSKSFSLYETGESLFRNDEPSPTRSAVLVRLSHSHLRIGTFQRLFAVDDRARLRRLLDYAVTTYYPHLPAEPAPFVAAVTDRVAATTAAWLVAGFVHGVLNTDNVNVTGESFDYGPWRFLVWLDPEFTAAYFDEGGLYAYGRQAAQMHWNLQQLARALAPLDPRAADGLAAWEERLWAHLRAALLRRLGVRSRGEAADTALVSAFFHALEATRIPFQRFFFDWYGGAAAADRVRRSPEAARYDRPEFAGLRTLLEEAVPAQDARLDHPFWSEVAPPTMTLPEVEAVWSAIDERDDWAPFEALIARVRAQGDALGTG